MSMGGTPGSLLFSDTISGPSWASGGAGVVGDAQSKFGGTALVAGGGSSAYIESSHASLAIGTSDFCWEGWVYRTSSPAAAIFMDMRASLTNGWYPALYYDSSGNIHYFLNNAEAIVGTGGNIPINTWTYVCLDRSGTSTKLWAGTSGTATQVGSTYTDSNNYAFGRLRYGANSYDANTGTNMAGYLDECRLTMASRHQTAPTVPTAAFPTA